MHVLIVDDSDSVRQTLIAIVQHRGYDVIGCANGLEAMHQLRTHGENPCLVFLDVIMPHMDGWEVLYEMQNDPHLATIPVVMISASGNYTRQALVHGAVSFLPKPFDIRMVMHIIKRYCADVSSKAL
jgi:CheY-like chemotaxis protein